MPKGAAFDAQVLKLIFQGVGIASLADNAAAGPLTSLYVALHTADPTAAGAQSTSEAAYAGYARAAVSRSPAGWTVTGGSASPAAAIVFPACAGGTATATNWSVGTAPSGAGEILYTGAISPSIAIAVGVTPQLTTASAITES